MIEGHIYTKGVITKDYPEELQAQIDALSPDTTNIVHHISSGGGNCYAAYKGFHKLMAVGKPIRSIIEGEAQSMATFLAIAPAYRVEMLDPSTWMIHEPFFPDGLEGALGVDDLAAAKDELEQIRSAMADAYAKKTGKTKDMMLAMMKKTTRMDANMAKAAGFIDEIISARQASGLGELITEFKNFTKEAMNIFRKQAVANGPTAIDLPLKDGKMIHVESETGDLVNKPATVDGVPAEGTYALQDGRQLVCTAGIVMSVTDAPAQQTEAQKLAAQVQQLSQQLAAIQSAEQAKIKAEAEQKAIDDAKAKAESEKVEAAKALEAKQKEVEALAAKVAELEKRPVGNQDKPFMGLTTDRTPVGFGQTSNDKKLIMATRTFLADEMPWMERYYKGGKFSDGTDFNSYRSGGPNAVSILETNFNYTWNGILTTDLFFKPTLGTPALADIFTIDQGASHMKRYNLVPALSNVLQPYTGCVSSANTNRIQITNATIQMKEFRMYEGWCKDDFTGQLSGSYNFLAQEWMKTGEASFDPAGTPIDKIIVAQLKDALRRDIFQRVSFAAGNSSSANYNQFDGLWDRLIDSAGASNYCVYRDGTSLGVGTLGSTVANDRFTSIFNNSNLLLKQEGIDSGEAQFVVTRSIWENYYAYLVAVGSVSEQEYVNYIQGIKRLTFRGIPVIPVSAWDSSLADSNNPLSATTRHLILFTLKRNHILGVENTGDLNNIQSWYEMKDSKRYYRADMKLGYQYLHCDLQTISY